MEFRSGEKSSYNFFRVLRTIWQRTGTSRTELSRMHHLDKTTVSHIVGELIDTGLVRVADIDSSATRPGRRSELLTLDDGWGCVAGIDIRPDGVSGCAADMHGRVIATHHHRQAVSRRNLKESFYHSLESLQADDRLQGRPIVGVGVGVGGIVLRGDSVIVHSIPLNIETPLDFNDIVGRHLPVPVIVDNDANCCAWGELVYDKADTVSDSLFVLLEFRGGAGRAELYGGEIALGLGFVLNGSVYYGEDGSAGEFRSLFWHPGYKNQFAVDDEDAVDILARPAALSTLIEELARHIALFVNTLNLKKVHIGGDTSSIREAVVDAVQEAIRHNWPYDEPVGCSVEVSTYDTDIVAIGAAAMILEHIFEEPVLPSGLRDRNTIWSRIMEGRKRPITVPMSTDSRYGDSR